MTGVINLHKYKERKGKRPFVSNKGQGILSALVSVLMFAIYAYVIAYRDPSIGTDTEAYMSLYANYHSRPDLVQQYEVGFVGFMNLVSLYSLDPRIFLLSISILINTLFYITGLAIFKRGSLLIYTALLLLSPFYFSLNTNGLRQGIALGICFLFAAILFKIRRVLIIAPLAIFSISYFHLPMILSYLGFIFKFRRRIIVLAWMASILLGLFSLAFSDALSALFDATKYDVYLDGQQTEFRTGLRIDFILFSLMPLVCYMLVPKNKSIEFRKVHFFLSAYAIINSIGMIVNFMPFYSRILLASWSATPIIYTLCLISIKGRGRSAMLNRLGIGFIVLITNLLGIITLT